MSALSRLVHTIQEGAVKYGMDTWTDQEKYSIDRYLEHAANHLHSARLMYKDNPVLLSGPFDGEVKDTDGFVLQNHYGWEDELGHALCDLVYAVELIDGIK